MIREYKLFLQDIVNAINDIDNFIKGMDYTAFYKDEKTKSAVVWKIEVIGEAAKNIPQNVRSKHKKVPWKDMAKIRDKIAHFYFGIDYEIVWKVVKERLSGIKKDIERIKAENK